MNTVAWRMVAAKNTTNRGSGRTTMNCEAAMPITKPTTVLASPPMPRIPLDNASCARPAAAPASSPVFAPDEMAM